MAKQALLDTLTLDPALVIEGNTKAGLLLGCDPGHVARIKRAGDLPDSPTVSDLAAYRARKAAEAPKPKAAPSGLHHVSMMLSDEQIAGLREQGWEVTTQSDIARAARKAREEKAQAELEQAGLSL